MPTDDIIPFTVVLAVLCIAIAILNSITKKTLWHQICDKFPLVEENKKYEWRKLTLIRIGSKLHRTNTKIRITPNFVSIRVLFAKPFSIPLDELVQSSHRKLYFHIVGFEDESFALPENYVSEIIALQNKTLHPIPSPSRREPFPKFKH